MNDILLDDDARQGLTLVLGGTGKTGRRVVERLRARGIETRAASRGSSPAFDWNDRSTWDAALEGVSRVYITFAPDLAVPGTPETMRALVERAVVKGVSRLVMGTAATSLVVATLAAADWGTPWAPFWLAGAALYLVGTFAVTAFGNVPLNDRLATASTVDPESLALWEHYLDRWTWLNTVRTAAAAGAALLFVIGLMRQSA